jgi:hypothetical protein
MTPDPRRRAYELMTQPDPEDCPEDVDVEPVPLTEEQGQRLVDVALDALRGRPR